MHHRYNNDGGRLSDQQMALLQYQRENLNFLSEEVNNDEKISDDFMLFLDYFN